MATPREFDPFEDEPGPIVFGSPARPADGLRAPEPISFVENYQRPAVLTEAPLTLSPSSPPRRRLGGLFLGLLGGCLLGAVVGGGVVAWKLRQPPANQPPAAEQLMQATVVDPSPPPEPPAAEEVQALPVEPEPIRPAAPVRRARPAPVRTAARAPAAKPPAPEPAKERLNLDELARSLRSEKQSRIGAERAPATAAEAASPPDAESPLVPRERRRGP